MEINLKSRRWTVRIHGTDNHDGWKWTIYNYPDWIILKTGEKSFAKRADAVTDFENETGFGFPRSVLKRSGVVFSGYEPQPDLRIVK